MKIAIFGGTGSVGNRLVPMLLAQGHHLALLTRRPDAAPQGVDIVEGDVTDAAAVRETLKGADLVYCLLGATLKDKSAIRTHGTSVIVAQMKRAGIDRMICLSSFGAGDSYAALPRLYRWVLAPLILKDMLKDHEGQEKILAESDLNWTVLRPVNLSDAHAAGAECGPTVAFRDRRRPLKVSREDVASCLKSLASDDTRRQQALWVTGRGTAA